VFDGQTVYPQVPGLSRQQPPLAPPDAARAVALRRLLEKAQVIPAEAVEAAANLPAQNAANTLAFFFAYTDT
jgi:hypothetical protein